MGLLYIWNDVLMRTLMLMAFVPTFLGMPFMQLLPVFQADVFHVGPSELGMMYTLVGIGSLVSSVMISSLASHPRGRQIQLVLGIGFGLGLVGLALALTYLVALGWLLLVGITSQGYMIINQILIMTHAGRELYGRVASVQLIAWSLNPAALLVLGAFIDRLGARPVVSAQGLVLALFILAIPLARRDMLNVTK